MDARGRGAGVKEKRGRVGEGRAQTTSVHNHFHLNTIVLLSSEFRGSWKRRLGTVEILKALCLMI